MDKDKKPPAGPDRMREVMFFLIIVLFISMMYWRLEQILSYTGADSFESLWAQFVAWFLSHLWPIIKIAAVIISALCAVGIYYNRSKLKEIAEEEKAVYGKSIITETSGESAAPLINERWERVLHHINSLNPSDWRQAIIEADVMLDELLKASGYHGDTLGERLKSVEPSDFLTIDAAWEAHKVRNRLAHEGSDFLLTDRDAKKTIAQFESVFKEFKII
jgi:hypothetical protein